MEGLMNTVFAMVSPIAYLSERYGHPERWSSPDVTILARTFEPHAIRFEVEVPVGAGRVIELASDKGEVIMEFWVEASSQVTKRLLCINE
jgi:hypothetical protein